MSMASLFPLKLKQNRMSALAVWCHVIITLLVVMSVKIIFSFLGDSSFDAVCSLIALFSFCWHTKKAGLKQTPPPKKTLDTMLLNSIARVNSMSIPALQSKRLTVLFSHLYLSPFTSLFSRVEALIQMVWNWTKNTYIQNKIQNKKKKIRKDLEMQAI